MDKDYRYIYDIMADILRDLSTLNDEANTDNTNATCQDGRKDRTTCQIKESKE